MKIEFRLLLIILFFSFSCKQSEVNKTINNQDRELKSNPNTKQKDYTDSASINKNCTCAENDFVEPKTDTIYQLSNGKIISLCGYRNPDSKPITFSEFVLSVCGDKKIIAFWDATKNCSVKTHKDTLIVEEQVLLPTKKDRSYETNIWGINKIYFKDNQVIKKHFINKKIRQYSEKEIEKTLKEYEVANQIVDDEKMQLVNRLFIATISDNNKARYYFYQFENKYNLDGASSEEYNDLKSMLEIWDKQN